jgi:hypothetical protein
MVPGTNMGLAGALGPNTGEERLTGLIRLVLLRIGEARLGLLRLGEARLGEARLLGEYCPGAFLCLRKELLRLHFLVEARRPLQAFMADLSEGRVPSARRWFLRQVAIFFCQLICLGDVIRLGDMRLEDKMVFISIIYANIF